MVEINYKNWQPFTKEINDKHFNCTPHGVRVDSFCLLDSIKYASQKETQTENTQINH
jgi:hypothetical protein